MVNTATMVSPCSMVFSTCLGVVLSCLLLASGVRSQGWTEGSLTVKRGRTAYLHPDELRITVKEGQLCKVEVLRNDPMTQRVGHMEPTVRFVFLYKIKLLLNALLSL